MHNEDFTTDTLQSGSLATVGTTAAALMSTVAKKPRQGMYVRWISGVTVYIGPSTVTAGVAAPTTDGFSLGSGDPWLFIPCDNPLSVYFRTASSTATLCFLIV